VQVRGVGVGGWGPGGGVGGGASQFPTAFPQGKEKGRRQGIHSTKQGGDDGYELTRQGRKTAESGIVRLLLGGSPSFSEAVSN